MNCKILFFLTTLTTPHLNGALIFRDQGLPTGAEGWSAQTSSITLDAVGDVGGAGGSYAFSGNQSFQVELTFSTDIQFRFGTDRSSTPTGANTSSGLIFRLPTGSNLTNGNSISITTTFPTGIGSTSTVPNIFNRGLGAGVTMPTPDIGSDSRFAYEVRFDPENNVDGGVNTRPGADDAPTDATLRLSGVHWDGSSVDFTPSPVTIGTNTTNTLYSYNDNGSGRIVNFRDATFGGFSGKTNGASINPDGSATFSYPTDSSRGFGFALVDNNDDTQSDAGTDNVAYQSLTTTITAGASDINELTRFRLSLDGGPVVIPEPSTTSLLLLPLLGLLQRQRKSF